MADEDGSLFLNLFNEPNPRKTGKFRKRAREKAKEDRKLDRITTLPEARRSHSKARSPHKKRKKTLENQDEASVSLEDGEQDNGHSCFIIAPLVSESASHLSGELRFMRFEDGGFDMGSSLPELKALIAKSNFLPPKDQPDDSLEEKEESAESASSESSDSDEEKGAKPIPADSLPQTKTLFVGGVPLDASRARLREVFKECGRITYSHSVSFPSFLTYVEIFGFQVTNPPPNRPAWPLWTLQRYKGLPPP